MIAALLKAHVGHIAESLAQLRFRRICFHRPLPIIIPATNQQKNPSSASSAGQSLFNNLFLFVVCGLNMQTSYQAINRSTNTKSCAEADKPPKKTQGVRCYCFIRGHSSSRAVANATSPLEISYSSSLTISFSVLSIDTSFSRIILILSGLLQEL
jgi:hypothetical protein